MRTPPLNSPAAKVAAELARGEGPTHEHDQNDAWFDHEIGRGELERHRSG